MTIKIRSFHWNKDFEKVRSFLIDCCNLTHSIHNWTPVRFENRKFGPCGKTVYKSKEDKEVQIWEDVNEKDKHQKKIVAVSIVERDEEWWVLIHPNYRYLEESIITWIEEQKRKVVKRNKTNSKLMFNVQETDEKRQAILKNRGYIKAELYAVDRTRPLNTPIPDYQLPEGYTIRHVDVMKDFVKYKEVLRSTFSHCGYMTQRQAQIYSIASFYNAELDLVVVAPDGNFAAFTTVRVDPKSKIVEFEPVGTHPNYRRLGLAKAIMIEGLKRLQKYQPTMITIPSAAADEGPSKLYDSLGFIDKVDVYIWQKIF